MMLPAIRHKRVPWWVSLGEAGYWLMPAASITAALLLSLLYVPRVPAAAIDWPALVMIYWAIYRPRWQPTGLVFIFALLCDLLSGTSLIGITAFIAVLVTVILRSQNHLLLALPFWAVWLVVGLFILGWRGIEAAAEGLVAGNWPGTAAWLASALLSVLAFPLVAFALSPLRRATFRF